MAQLVPPRRHRLQSLGRSATVHGAGRGCALGPRVARWPRSLRGRTRARSRCWARGGLSPAEEPMGGAGGAERRPDRRFQTLHFREKINNNAGLQRNKAPVRLSRAPAAPAWQSPGHPGRAMGIRGSARQRPEALARPGQRQVSYPEPGSGERVTVPRCARLTSPHRTAVDAVGARPPFAGLALI